MKKNFLIFIVIIIIGMSCTQNTSNNSSINTDENIKDTIKHTTISYKIPSPIELYLFLKENNAEFNKNSINVVENISKYYKNSSKAINFGIYASDLAYCTVFDMHQEIFLYFSTTRSLADELGIAEGFDEILITKINENLNNNDSLFKITNDSYADACQFLQENGKEDILSLIFTGSWIESLNITLNSVSDFSKDTIILKRIADQRYLLDNLVEYLKANNNNITIKNILAELFDLQSSFDLLYENSNNTPITKKQFDEIGEKTKTIRDEFIN